MNVNTAPTSSNSISSTGEVPKLPISTCTDLFFRNAWRPELYEERSWKQLGITAVVHLLLCAGLVLVIYGLFFGKTTDNEHKVQVEQALKHVRESAPANEPINNFNAGVLKPFNITHQQLAKSLERVANNTEPYLDSDANVFERGEILEWKGRSYNVEQNHNKNDEVSCIEVSHDGKPLFTWQKGLAARIRQGNYEIPIREKRSNNPIALLSFVTGISVEELQRYAELKSKEAANARPEAPAINPPTHPVTISGLLTAPTPTTPPEVPPTVTPTPTVSPTTAPAAVEEGLPTWNGLPELPMFLGDLVEMQELQTLTAEKHQRLQGWYDSVKKLNSRFIEIMKSGKKQWAEWMKERDELNKHVPKLSEEFSQMNIAERMAAMPTKKEHTDAESKLKNLEGCLAASKDKAPLTEEARNGLLSTIAYQQALVTQIEAQHLYWDGYKYDAL